jgi:hypothetical protein
MPTSWSASGARFSPRTDGLCGIRMATEVDPLLLASRIVVRFNDFELQDVGLRILSERT